MKGCAGEVAWLSSHAMFHPSPSPSHHSADVVVVAAGEILVKDGFGPEYPQGSRC